MSLSLILSKRFLFVFALMLTISVSIVYASLESRKTSDEFIGITTLGREKMIDSYYPEGIANIHVNDSIQWYIQVDNKMKNPQYLAVKAKIMNITQSISEDTDNQPIGWREIFEDRRLVASNSTWTIPLNWTVTNTEKSGNYTIIKDMNVNGIDISNIDVQSINGKNFRIVIELLRYNMNTKEFESSWEVEGKIKSAQNQLWFSIK